MNLSESVGVYAEIIHEGLETNFTDHLLYLRNKLLHLKPWYTVPIEMSVTLFFLVNIYKGIAINMCIGRRQSNAYAVCTMLALALEIPKLENSFQLVAYPAMCILLPLPMLFHDLYKWVGTILFMCFSRPLAWCSGQLFLMFTLLRGEKHLPVDMYFKYYSTYFVACNLIAAYIDFLVNLYGLSPYVMFFMALYSLLSIAFLSVKMGDSLYYPNSLQFRVELVCYLTLPFMWDSYSRQKYGENLTYAIQLFKPM